MGYFAERSGYHTPPVRQQPRGRRQPIQYACHGCGNFYRWYDLERDASGDLRCKNCR